MQQTQKQTRTAVSWARPSKLDFSQLRSVLKLQFYASTLYKCANECHRGLFIEHKVVVVYYFVTECKQEYRDFMGFYVWVGFSFHPWFKLVFCFRSTSLRCDRQSSFTQVWITTVLGNSVIHLSNSNGNWLSQEITLHSCRIIHSRKRHWVRMPKRSFYFCTWSIMMKDLGRTGWQSEIDM